MKEYIIKLQQFLTEEEELLEDFAMDVESPEASNREKARAVAFHASQYARVSAIRDVIELLGLRNCYL